VYICDDKKDDFFSKKIETFAAAAEFGLLLFPVL
jgi:hypothetical protein